MKYLLLLDFKAGKKILILYYIIVALASILIHPALGCVVMIFAVRIEREVCKDNALMGLPIFYKNFPNKNLYPDEKNLFFYLVILGAMIIWSMICFAVKINGFQTIMDKLRLIIGLGMLIIFICNIYHIIWMYFFFQYQDTVVCMKMVSKYYIILPMITIIISRNHYLYEKLGVIFQFNWIVCFILIILNILTILFGILFIRKSYEKNEMN